jgi:hypothetical protein
MVNERELQGVNMRKLTLFLLSALSVLSCTTYVITGQPQNDQQLVILNGREVVLDRTDDIKTYLALEYAGDDARFTLQIETEEEDEALDDGSWIMSYEDWNLTVKDNYRNTDEYSAVDPEEWWETQQNIHTANTVLNILSVVSDTDNAYRAGSNQARANDSLAAKRVYYEAMLKKESIVPNRVIQKFLVFYDVDPGEYILEWEGPKETRTFHFLVEKE